MKRFSLSTLVVMGLLAWAFAAAAGNGGSGKRFLGLWQGIDPLDGSSQTVEISPGADGGFGLLWAESYWTVCDGRRAVLEGTGETASGDRNTLVFQMAVTCFDPESVPVQDAIRFRIVGQNMLLATVEGVFTDLPFFRVSGRVRGGGHDDD